MHALRKEYASEGEGDRSDYERSQKMTDAKKKIEGIGPTTKDGMPVALRSVRKNIVKLITFIIYFSRKYKIIFMIIKYE